VTFPAWFELYRDRIISQKPSACRVYAYLLENPRCQFEIQDVKAWLVAEELGMARDSVNEALNLLIQRGYVLDHGRGQNNVRRLTVAITRAA
jgi:DNA-binding MarR family transcriptional regulator